MEVATVRGEETRVTIPRCLGRTEAADGSRIWSVVEGSENPLSIGKNPCDSASAIRRPIGVVFTSAASLQVPLN